MNYPLRIRFWYAVHNAAERFSHWVYCAKIQRANEEQARITERAMYAAPAVTLTELGPGQYNYRITSERPRFRVKKWRDGVTPRDDVPMSPQ
jgi:hypothetical protein